MRRDHHTGIARHGAVLVAALVATLLVALTAAPAGADATAGSGAAAGATSAAGAGSGAAAGPLRNEAFRAVRAHEKARARVDRLRHDEEVHPKTVRDAERRREAIRSELWDMLRAEGRQAGDPVAVDPAGHAGHCRINPRKPRETPSAPRRDDTWTAPTRDYRLSAAYAARGPQRRSRWPGRRRSSRGRPGRFG
ncbi:hypothetical protein ACFYWX_03460 [Streptomyces sp. NPDC002888]|uniref:hypothetical protein n=1 Tax=Streptomyces sp. NPDC002888 TaxID=3364668 RepID=UPI00368A5E79